MPLVESGLSIHQNLSCLKKRGSKYVIFLLMIAFVWLFVNQAMYSHSHILSGGQIITHAHPYTPDKNSNSPFQSHKHLPGVAFFLDLITNLNVDMFGALLFFLFLLALLAFVPISRTINSYQEYYATGTGRSPPVLF